MNRINDIAGRNAPTQSYIDQQGLYYVTAAWTDYDGDNGGKVTTLNHTLSLVGLLPNIIIKDVMDTNGSGMLCYEYA